MRIDEIKGIGPKKKKCLEKLGLYTVDDLLTHYPKRYEIPAPVKLIADSEDQASVRLKLRVGEMRRVKRYAYDKERLHLTAYDSAGTSIEVVFFNAQYRVNQLTQGMVFFVEGQLKVDGIRRTMIHPEWLTEEEVTLARVRPVFSLTDGISQAEMRRYVQSALVVSNLHETLPDSLIARCRLMGKEQALNEIHYPTNKKDFLAAKYRLVYEELFTLQLALLVIKQGIEKKQKKQTYKKRDLYDRCLKCLPFSLTEGQKKVLAEIEKDLKQVVPMHRLLQGDVGSGKTVLALLSLILALDNGYQGAFMVPTEVLAEQHYLTFKSLFSPEIQDKVVLLTGGTKSKQKVYDRMNSGENIIVIGTHALIEEKAQFSNLRLIVTDEQHRFGVEQRMQLQEKGSAADVLVMSATPIPRTLSMIRYGDMEISILDQVPAGRQQVETRKIKRQNLGKLAKNLTDELNKGHQLYFVCPLIEENEALDLQSAEALFSKLTQLYKNHTVALLHGKLKPQEKERIMNGFASNEVQVLVSTTVIEVGINVPNATVMCIVNAERFGLAQLHQLRGRVGRGKAKSYCYLVSSEQQVENNQRLEVLVSSHDGFYIAEKDLELRGPGEILGKRQHGLPELVLADFIKHKNILVKVQEDAQWLLGSQESSCRSYLSAIVEKLAL